MEPANSMVIRGMIQEAMRGYVTVEECDRRIQVAVTEALKRYTPWPMKIFGLNGSKPYAERVARHLGVELTAHTEEMWDDGEFYLKAGKRYDESVHGNVRGHKVFVISSLFESPEESVADKFVKLCLFCGSLRDASAYEVIPVIPKICWDRQDRKTESRAPIATKYVAQIMETGISRALFVDVHNLAAEQNAFRVPIDNLEAKRLFAEWCAQRYVSLYGTSNNHKLRIMTPDSGGLYRCERFRSALAKCLKDLGVALEVDDLDIVVYDKRKVNDKHMGGHVIGDVENALVIGYDDMISTMKTMGNACDAVVRQHGQIFAICATHGFFCGEANEIMSKIKAPTVIADTIDPFRLSAANRGYLHTVDTTPMVADAIQRIHSGTGSIAELLNS